jgi:hypothetical protein
LPQIVSKKFEPQKMELPECISSGAWEEWITYRRQRKLSCAEITLNAQLRNLECWHNDGHNANDIISRSIANGWQGLFEIKLNDRSGLKPNGTPKVYHDISQMDYTKGVSHDGSF